MALSWTNKWVWLSLSGALASWGIVLLHQYCNDCLAVRILEVMVAIASIVINGYVVANFTGDVQCPSNLYFSIWSSFFLSVWIFSMIVQENRSLNSFLHDD